MATKEPDKKQQADLQQVVGPIRDATNVLVTINSSPTVDQLASCIGLTLVLNKLGKHATAVFSGKVPSTLEFLKPEETLEKNTDSLRDFIISLDKSKADKLRYKVEDDVVKIFITPYKVSIGEEDLEFSQGDFNVDVVVALGVEEKKHLDEAILAHGRILHDATVISINAQSSSHLGSINWSSQETSSLCEMVADIVQSLSKDVLDPQNSTALLTGIVAETERYSNEKATPHTMSIAGALMSAGASTQLVSNELDSVLKAQELPSVSAGEKGTLEEGADGANSGVLDIDHNDKDEEASDKTEEDKPAETQQDQTPEKPKDEYLDDLNLSEDPHKPAPDSDDIKPEEPDRESPAPSDKISGRLVKDPPHFTGQLTANTVAEDRQYTGSTDPLTNIPESTLLGANADKDHEDIRKNAAARANSLQQKVDQTLKEIEESVSSPHLDQEEQQQEDIKGNDQPEAASSGEMAQLSVDEARKAAEAVSGEDDRPEARQDMGTTRLGDDIDHNNNSSSNPPPPVPPPITPSS
jgi:nanoRNase/pAp phosphatase (c-di-AMP/oligoRNAs hydrolase)